MYKNQLQELAQRCCLNLPSYACIREGPDHGPRFKATVSFNGEIFESPGYCGTLRQAEHAAAEVALSVLSRRGPSQSLAAKILDDSGVCKNLLQETAQRAGVLLPTYTTVRSGPGHLPVFTCTVEVSGMQFVGEPAKTKKQAEKNAAMAAWTTLKKFVSQDMGVAEDLTDEQEQGLIARTLSMAVRRTESARPLPIDDKSRASCRSLSVSQRNHSRTQQQPLYQPVARLDKPRITLTPIAAHGLHGTVGVPRLESLRSLKSAHEEDEDAWICGVDASVKVGTSAVSEDFGSSRWSTSLSVPQWWKVGGQTTESAHCGSLAPPVRIRTVQPVHASRPVPREAPIAESVEEEATRQVLSQLSL